MKNYLIIIAIFAIAIPVEMFTDTTIAIRQSFMANEVVPFIGFALMGLTLLLGILSIVLDEPKKSTLTQPRKIKRNQLS